MIFLFLVQLHTLFDFLLLLFDSWRSLCEFFFYFAVLFFFVVYWVRRENCLVYWTGYVMSSKYLYFEWMLFSCLYNICERDIAQTLDSEFCHIQFVMWNSFIFFVLFRMWNLSKWLLFYLFVKAFGKWFTDYFFLSLAHIHNIHTFTHINKLFLLITLNSIRCSKYVTFLNFGFLFFCFSSKGYGVSLSIKCTFDVCKNDFVDKCISHIIDEIFYSDCVFLLSFIVYEKKREMMMIVGRWGLFFLTMNRANFFSFSFLFILLLSFFFVVFFSHTQCNLSVWLLIYK